MSRPPPILSNIGHFGANFIQFPQKKHRQCERYPSCSVLWFFPCIRRYLTPSISAYRYPPASNFQDMMRGTLVNMSKTPNILSIVCGDGNHRCADGVNNNYLGCCSNGKYCCGANANFGGWMYCCGAVGQRCCENEGCCTSAATGCSEEGKCFYP